MRKTRCPRTRGQKNYGRLHHNPERTPGIQAHKREVSIERARDAPADGPGPQYPGSQSPSHSELTHRIPGGADLRTTCAPPRPESPTKRESPGHQGICARDPVSNRCEEHTDTPGLRHGFTRRPGPEGNERATPEQGTGGRQRPVRHGWGRGRGRGRGERIHRQADECRAPR